MYPDFHYFLKDLFGLDIPFLSLFKMFGFIVAIAFFVGGYIIFKELKRKEDDGIVGFTIDEVTVGKPATIFDYITSLIIGFLVGYKLIGMFINWSTATQDPLNYLFSKHGVLWSGLVAAALALAYRFYINKEETANGIQTKKMKTFPSTRVGDVAVIAALGGFAGAKVFNALETWDDFVRDPLGSLFSSSGLTFYGGLIVATFALWYFARKINLDFRHLCDAAAPALILAYGIGRLGCQVSGDGDWGVFNAAYITNDQGKVVEAPSINFQESTSLYQEYFTRHYKPNEEIPHIYFKKPSFLPTWFVAYNYPANVNNVGVELSNCTDKTYCSVLPVPVFPTPVYEFFACSILFVFLWSIRKHFNTPLSIFSIYLMVNGIERFFVENIRVNYKYDWGFLHPTQAEILAVVILLTGILLFLFRTKIDALVTKSATSQN